MGCDEPDPTCIIQGKHKHVATKCASAADTGDDVDKHQGKGRKSSRPQLHHNQHPAANQLCTHLPTYCSTLNRCYLKQCSNYKKTLQQKWQPRNMTSTITKDLPVMVDHMNHVQQTTPAGEALNCWLTHSLHIKIASMSPLLSRGE